MSNAIDDAALVPHPNPSPPGAEAGSRGAKLHAAEAAGAYKAPDSGNEGEAEQSFGTSSRRRAAALSYGHAEVQGDLAPRLVAKGNGLIADEIIARAHAAGVPVHESRELVALLMQLDLDAQIPPALYVAVAEVLAWVYRLENRAVPEAVQAAQAEPK